MKLNYHKSKDKEISIHDCENPNIAVISSKSKSSESTLKVLRRKSFSECGYIETVEDYKARVIAVAYALDKRHRMFTRRYIHVTFYKTSRR